MVSHRASAIKQTRQRNPSEDIKRRQESRDHAELVGRCVCQKTLQTLLANIRTPKEQRPEPVGALSLQPEQTYFLVGGAFSSTVTVPIASFNALALERSTKPSM